MHAEQIPRVALLTAAFFVASLVHIPLGPSSAHLAMTGLMGVLMGWSVFPAVFVGLVLQAVFFGYGGVTVLGVNTLIMAAPAILAGAVFRAGLDPARNGHSGMRGFLAGAGAIAGSALLLGLALALSGREFVPAAKLALLGHVPLMVVEGLVTASAVLLLQRVMPELWLKQAPGPAGEAA
jgi:cobalt/nickel transport system permease protein